MWLQQLNTQPKASQMGLGMAASMMYTHSAAAYHLSFTIKEVLSAYLEPKTSP